MKLFIAVPTYGEWTADMAHSLALTMADLAAHDGPASMRLVRCEATILAAGRMDLVREAVRTEATHILWVDTDMRFRPDAVRSMIGRDVDIVGVDYLRRNPPHTPVAKGMDGKYIDAKDGLVEALHTGMGLMLTKVSVFEKLAEPWFNTPWREETKDFIGEDVWFCRIARDAGMKVYVDCDASKGIGHVSKHVITAE